MVCGRQRQMGIRGSSIEGVYVPTRFFRICGRVRAIGAAVWALHRDFTVGFQFVGAEKQPIQRREDDVPVSENAAEGDIGGISKLRAVRPGFPSVLGKQDPAWFVSESQITALGFDVGISWREAIAKVFGGAILVGGQEAGKRNRRARGDG